MDFDLAVPANRQSRECANMVLIPGKRAFPSTYAVRFTTTQHEELETRAYDGDKELLVTNSVRDSLGRSWKKFLPFALPCSNPLICNSEMKTLRNQEMANQYYTSDNPDYPDAGGYAYAETKWKPDQSATKDVVGAPGTSYSIASGHLVRAFSSGVNLSDVDLLDSSELSNAVSAVANALLYDSLQKNYHAKKDDNPTHVWSMNEDQDGRRSFSVVDGEGHTIVSGSLGKDGNMLTRSVNILDERGNVIESHSPMSCSFKPTPVGCVTSSKFWYDSESRVVKSEEPDAGVTYTYYDFAGRVRATQTQNQIDSGKVSVVGYDYLDRTEYTGLWLNAGDRDSLTRYFADTNHKKSPTVDELVVGTVTRSFYNRVPFRDTLGVELFPAKIDSANVFKYSRGRLVATISDIGDDESGKTLRISNSISYDKYGRVLKTFTYDASMALDSLKMMTSENVYDQGGKVVTNSIYPYGLNEGALTRKITNRYSYDLLGRVDTLFSTNGAGKEFVLAAYSYYPTGSVKKIVLGNSIEISYTYHISGAVRTASAVKLPGRDNLYYEEMYYDDCGGIDCTAQYNGNISRVFHDLAHGSDKFPEVRDVAYYYDELNRLVNVDDEKSDFFDEKFKYDPQGRIVMQRRGAKMDVLRIGGDYVYYDSTNKLARVYGHMSLDNSGNSRDMSADSNFVYDSEGNLIEDKSKNLKISYDWRGMPVEFRMESKSGNVLENTRSCSRDSVRVLMAYDGSGRRVSKTRYSKACVSDEADGVYAADWERELVTHYTGIGTEVRESYRNNALEKTKVVVNMPNGLGRYGVSDVILSDSEESSNTQLNEFYLKNHLGSTMMVAKVSSSNAPAEISAAYDYRAFGEQVTLSEPTDKVTENFTGKERDDETELNYFGARYLDPMLGMWISVDPARQFSSPYLYVGNGYNPIVGVDPDGNVVHVEKNGRNINYTMYVKFDGGTPKDADEFISSVESFYTRKVGQYNISMKVVNDPELAENTIEFVDKIGRSYAGCDNSYNCNYAKIFTKNPGNTSGIHESGHLMGMKDRYTDEDGTFDGFVGNMMGDKGNGLSPLQVEETLRKKENTYENFDPFNGD